MEVQTNDWREFTVRGRDSASWTFGFEARAPSAVLPFKAKRDRYKLFTLPKTRQLELRLQGSESAIKRNHLKLSNCPSKGTSSL
ncbi:hypothetical protein MHYP_G00260240 [Metynnis hypsauchen]